MNSLKVSYFFQSLVILLLMVFPREATKNTSEYINEILNRNTKNIEVVPYCEKDSRKVKDQFKTARKVSIQRMLRNCRKMQVTGCF